MKLRRCRRRDERGASLILAIAFMVVVGSVGAAVLSSVTSGLNDRPALNQLRNRDYAADGGIENAIAQVRSIMTTGKAFAPCTGLTAPPSLDGVQIHVACSDVSTLTTSGYYQRNIIFTACLASQPSCSTATSSIIRAQVNFASPSILTDNPINVTRTYIQSWSVNA